MDVQRIRGEVVQAARKFAYVEAHPTSGGGLLVRAAFQTSVLKTYIVEVQFEGYPYRMPQVRVTRPTLRLSPHQYINDGMICYLHPNLWNPGKHDLSFVLARTAKWLNKYDVYLQQGRWPGAGHAH